MKNELKYLDSFQQAADHLDKHQLNNHQVETIVGIFLDSVVLKLYKKSWANSLRDPVTSESRIFFSIWINEETLRHQEVRYNIHALKLRKLEGYRIESRKFAEVFRNKFKTFQYLWPNVRIDFGPLTLMEGWIPLDADNLTNQITDLANNFLKIEGLIDDTLIPFKK